MSKTKQPKQAGKAPQTPPPPKRDPLVAITDALATTVAMMKEGGIAVIPPADSLVLQTGITQQMEKHAFAAMEEHEQYIFTSDILFEELEYWAKLSGEEKLKAFQIINGTLPQAGKRVVDGWIEKYGPHGNHLANLLGKQGEVEQSMKKYRYAMERIAALGKLKSKN